MNSNTPLVYIEKEVASTNIQFNPTGAVISPDATYEELLKTGKKLKQFEEVAESCIHWILGDLLRFAEGKFSDKVSQLEHEWGFSYKTYANDKWVCKNIDFSIRIEKIYFRHYQIIAPFKPEEQKIWIKKILENGIDGKIMTQDFLKAAVREHKKFLALEDARKHQNKNSPVVKKQDALEFLDSFENRSVDLLLTDPPYMTDVDDIHKFAFDWTVKALRKVKPTGRAYIFIGAYPRELNAYIQQCEAQDQLEFANIMVWHYKNTLGPDPKMKYKKCWQAILYLYGKDAEPLNSEILLEKMDVQEFIVKGERQHRWEKPIELAELLIMHSTKIGDLIIDPFVGTGTFLIAAKGLGREAIGSEIDHEMLEIAESRGCLKVENKVSE